MIERTGYEKESRESRLQVRPRAPDVSLKLFRIEEIKISQSK